LPLDWVRELELSRTNDGGYYNIPFAEKMAERIEAFRGQYAFPTSNEEMCQTLEVRVRTGLLAFTIYVIAILRVQLVQLKGRIMTRILV
jgi:hypothetical protein